MPGNTSTMVKSITVDDKAVDYTVAGEQSILVLGGIDQTKVGESPNLPICFKLSDRISLMLLNKTPC